MPSRFIDKVKIYLKAGDGGKGCISFRREKYVPRGGPNGGDGGGGADIVFRVDSNLNTLYDFKYHPHVKAPNGRPGMGDNRSGKKGETLVVPVPPGTTVQDFETGETMADLVSEGQEVVIAKGGKGGRGNQHFATSKNRVPRYCEPGTPGEERTVVVELRSIADVGLVGFPNAGKSTLLRAISAATPEVAPYPFTTLTPHLGVVDVAGQSGQTFVMADIPGLIVGASEGKGLGREFLRHIERTSVLLYVIDAGGFDGDPIKDFREVKNEVFLYSEAMRKKRSLVALNKVDLIPSRGELDLLVEALEDEAGAPVMPISGQEKTGIRELTMSLFKILSEIKTTI
jgi:GTP-binding protein